MKKVLFIFGFVLALTVSSNYAFAATTKIYPTSDAVAQLYDDDGITDWQIARNYQGELYRTPFESGTLDNTGKIYVRSDNGSGFYRIYRASNVFDLSKIPPGAQIEGATLKLYKTLGNNQGDIQVVVTSHTRQNPSIYQKSDWKINTFGSKEFSRNLFQNDKYTNFDFNTDGVDYITSKVGSLATIGVLTQYDFDDTIPNSAILAAGWYESEMTGTDFDPYLEVTYSVPDQAGIDRAAFIALVKEATKDESRIVQKFFVAAGNRLFDFIEGGRTKLALLDLKVLSVLLNAKGIHDDALNIGISRLQTDLKE